jgi:hypothetical protein
MSVRLRGSWAPIDTGFLRDHRVRRLSKAAKLLKLACDLRANESQTDGILGKSDLRLAAAEADLDAKEEVAAVGELVSSGLLVRAGSDYVISDFRGLSRVERERHKEQARIRQARKRERDKSVTVTRDVLPAEGEVEGEEEGEEEVTNPPVVPPTPQAAVEKRAQTPRAGRGMGPANGQMEKISDVLPRVVKERK